jgi:hypothetical protein
MNMRRYGGIYIQPEQYQVERHDQVFTQVFISQYPKKRIRAANFRDSMFLFGFCYIIYRIILWRPYNVDPINALCRHDRRLRYIGKQQARYRSDRI